MLLFNLQIFQSIIFVIRINYDDFLIIFGDGIKEIFDDV